MEIEKEREREQGKKSEMSDVLLMRMKKLLENDEK
jgi:hypothetical protein